MSAWTLWGALLLAGITAAWALVRWTDPVGGGRALRAASAALVAAAVMSATAWTGAAASLCRAPARIVKEWVEDGALRRVDRPTAAAMASLRLAPGDRGGMVLPGCELVDLDPPRMNPYGSPTCRHSHRNHALRCPIGDFRMSVSGGSCMGNSWSASGVSWGDWYCSSSATYYSGTPSTEPLYDVSRRVSMRASPDGRLAEYTCEVEHCWMSHPPAAGHVVPQWSDGRLACDFERIHDRTPPPLYLTREPVRRHVESEIFPSRWREETARLALLSTLLGLLAILLVRRSVEPSRAMATSTPRLGAPYRATETPVGDRRPVLVRAHASRLLAVFVVYVAASVAMIRVISR